MTSELEHNIAMLLKQSVHEPPRQVTVEDVADRLRSRRRTRLIAPIAAAATVAAIAIGTVVIRTDHGTAPPRPPAGQTTAAAPLTSTRFGVWVLRHPRDWTYVAAEDHKRPAGATRVLGYLTNEPTIAQCVTRTAPGHTDYACGLPVARLTARGVLVTVTTFLVPKLSAGPGPNRIINGQPAQVVDPVLVRDTSCPAGTAHASFVAYWVANPNGLTVTACLGSENAHDIAAVKALINTATFTPRTNR